MRTVTYRLVDLLHATINLGFRGENEHTRIIFDAKKVFEDYPTSVPSLAVTPPQGSPYPAVCVRDGDLVYWDVLDSDVAYDGNGEGQLTFTVNGVVAKSYVFKTKISRSILPTGEVPSPINDWITRANTALNEIPQAIETKVAQEMAADLEYISEQRELAQTARVGAVEAKEDASGAKDAAVAAKDAAVEAQRKAESAQDAVEAAATAAAGSATAAAGSATDAAGSATNAAGSATAAAESAEAAKNAKEQAATILHDTVKKVNGQYPDDNGNVNTNILMQDDCVELFETVLTEAIYGSDQRDNISALCKLLTGISVVSISAALNETPLIGTKYADLDISVTATYSDETTTSVYSYGVSAGEVVEGSNTVTISYRGKTAIVTFTAMPVVTHSITNNLTNATNSNNAYVIVHGERYEAEIEANEGCKINTCTVMMGGVNITSTAYISGTIIIAEVTGDIEITAVASEITYLDDLLYVSRGGFTNALGYPNESTSETWVIGGAYSYAPFVTEYPALNNCTIHWKIKNITEDDLALTNCGFGSISNYNNNFLQDNSLIHAFNCSKVDNSSHKLAPGGELEGDFSVKAGDSPCFICLYADFPKFEIEMNGNYAPNTFDDYTEINPTTATAPVYGQYRTMKYYTDAGTTLYTQFSGYPYLLLSDVEPGTYDVYICTRASELPQSGDSNAVVATMGGVSQNTDTDVYYAGGTKYYQHYNLWFHTQFTITSQGMNLIASIQRLNLLNDTNPELLIKYKKVVNE